MSEKRKYDSTVARMAGNIAAGMMDGYLKSPMPDRDGNRLSIIAMSVQIARAIVAEVERTEPKADV